MIKTLQILKLQQQITRLEVEDFTPRSLPPKKCERSYVSLGKVKKNYSLAHSQRDRPKR